jgi:hypothetical protein
MPDTDTLQLDYSYITEATTSALIGQQEDCFQASVKHEECCRWSSFDYMGMLYPIRERAKGSAGQINKMSGK